MPREDTMTNGGYEQAKANRNVLEKLGEKIPGFRGFQDRELRRDVDKLQREHLAADIGRLKAALRDRTRSYTDAGQVGEPELQRLYAFDLSLLDDLAGIEAEIGTIPAPGGAAGDSPAAALDQVQQRVRALEDKWRQRARVMSDVVQGAPGA